jgi:hypothetical protein
MPSTQACHTIRPFGNIIKNTTHPATQIITQKTNKTTKEIIIGTIVIRIN